MTSLQSHGSGFNDGAAGVRAARPALWAFIVVNVVIAGWALATWLPKPMIFLSDHERALDERLSSNDSKVWVSRGRFLSESGAKNFLRFAFAFDSDDSNYELSKALDRDPPVYIRFEAGKRMNVYLQDRQKRDVKRLGRFPLNGRMHWKLVSTERVDLGDSYTISVDRDSDGRDAKQFTLVFFGKSFRLTEDGYTTSASLSFSEDGQSER